VFLKHLNVGFAGILHTTIRVVNESRRRLPTHNRLSQGAEGKSRLQRSVEQIHAYRASLPPWLRRCPLVASAEVTELGSGTLLSARISELGLGSCYVDALNPFPEGTLIGLRILRDQGVFETKAKVVYCDPRFGMGLAFTDVTPDQRSLLEAWFIVGMRQNVWVARRWIEKPRKGRERA
jgi:hypothetical protein